MKTKEEGEIVKTRKKFLKYIDEMSGLGLVHYDDYKKIKERIEKHPWLR